MDAYPSCLRALGECLLDAGRYDEALERFLECHHLTIDEGSGMTPDFAASVRPYSLAQVGECLGLLGRRTEAMTALTEAIALMEQSQVSDYREGRARERLAAVLAEEGRADDSRRAYARAAELFEAIGDAEASSRCHDLANAAR
jgi:tetratricopeptide (TPR) repeat protein